MIILTCTQCSQPFQSRTTHPYCSHTCANRARAQKFQIAPEGYWSIRRIAEHYGWSKPGIWDLIRRRRRKLRATWDGRRWLVATGEVERAERAGVFRRQIVK